MKHAIECTYSAAFCTRYGLHVLAGEKFDVVDNALSTQQVDGVEILEHRIHDNNIWLVIEVSENISPRAAVVRIKSMLSAVLSEKFPELKAKMHSFWKRSVSIHTLGSIDDANEKRTEFLSVQLRRHSSNKKEEN